MQELLDTLANNAAWAYALLFAYSLGGGMVALLAAALLCASGALDIYLCVLIASVANFLGDEGLYYFAKLNRKQALPYFARHRRKLALAQVLFRRYGAGIILIKKYIYGLKTLVPIAIGFSRFNDMKFCAINAISATIWGLSLGCVGFFAGDLVSLLAQKFGENNSSLVLGLLAILGLLWLYFSLASRKKGKKA